MEGIVLPQDLNIDTSRNIQVFNYQRQENVEKLKITLSKNTISFLQKGQKEVFGDNKTVKLGADKFVLMKSGKCLMTEKISDQDQLYHSILLFFSDDLVRDFLEKNELYDTSERTSDSFYTFEYDSFLDHFAKGLENVLQLEGLNDEKILKAKFEELMQYLTARHGAGFLNDMLETKDNSAHHLRAIVESNLYNKLSTQELAFLSHMSVSTFKREFQKEYQESPIKYFRNKRLEYVASLLKTQQRKPIELFEEAGYDNFSNFIQAFKRKFGLTPKQFQNQ